MKPCETISYSKFGVIHNNNNEQAIDNIISWFNEKLFSHENKNYKVLVSYF